MPDFDAIVVGSGVSGGWAAKELTERGLKVLMVDRGRMVRHGDDYLTEHRAPWEMPFHGFGDRRRYARDQAVQSRCGNFNEGSDHFFINDTENPYENTGKDEFDWIRGDQVGGRSLIWGRYAMRYAEHNFTDNLRDGYGVDWPIRYQDLEPWYRHVEEFIGVSGTAAGLAELPDSQFLPPLPVNCVEEHVADVMKEEFGRYLLPARAAILTREHKGRSACHFCGPCYRGCSSGSYFSTQSSTLPAANATRRLTLLSDTLVESVDYDPSTGRATGVRVIDRKTMKRRVVTARLIFLNASTIATTQILLNSVSERFPRGLANDSGELGRNLMDHVLGPRVIGRFDTFAESAPSGSRPSGVGILVAPFRNIGAADVPFLRRYHYQGSASRQLWNRAAENPGIGAAFKTGLRTPGPWTMFLGGLGECLPNPANIITVDRDRRDRWGLPKIRIAFAWSDNERKMAKDIASEGEKMLAAAGASAISVSAALSHPGQGIHEAGTARMGRDPRNSVLNGNNRAHAVSNLFVTDGACLPSSPNQNPSLTYMALTARACDFAVRALKEGKL